MKKFIYMLLPFAVCLSACEKEIDFPYQGGKDRIHFKHYTIDANRTRVYYDIFDTIPNGGKKVLGRIYSQGFVPDDQDEVTIKIPVELLGRLADRERTYQVAVVPELSTAVEGVHYEPIGATHTFAAGAISDTLRVVVNKSAMSTSFTNPTEYDLALRIVPTDDFDIGLAGGETVIFRLNNYLSKPRWWDTYEGGGGALYYFHPLKWKILIEFDPAWANYDSAPYNVNTGRFYFIGLENYLNSNLVIDTETNKRLFMTTMEDYN